MSLHEKYAEMARDRGGRLISLYVNSHTKLEWECEHGHRWMASPNNIGKGRWCPVCNGGGTKNVGSKPVEKITYAIRKEPTQKSIASYREGRMKEGLSDLISCILQPRYGLQGIIEDGNDPEERATYYEGILRRIENRARETRKELEL